MPEVLNRLIVFSECWKRLKLLTLVSEATQLSNNSPKSILHLVIFFEKLIYGSKCE